MHRQLAALDRWYAEQAAPGTRGGDGRRRFLVATTTVVIGLLATGHLLHSQGYDLGLDGVHARRGSGPSTVATGTGAYSFLAHQPGRASDPVTYHPCRTIHLVVNDALAPRGSDGLLPEAAATVAAATGLRLVVDGRTDEQPGRDRALRDPRRYGRGWSPVLVAWTTPEQVPGLAGRVAGLGGSSRVVDDLSGRSTYVTGTVSLDAPALAATLARPGGAALVRAVVLHELGHVVGLAHVDDARELMYRDNVGQTSFGSGDLAGLAALGRGRCVGQG
jgi:hypothetical protein